MRVWSDKPDRPGLWVWDQDGEISIVKIEWWDDLNAFDYDLAIVSNGNRKFLSSVTGKWAGPFVVDS